MQACDLAELSALITAYGPLMVRGKQPVSNSGVEQYWSASRRRFDRWSQTFHDARPQPGTDWRAALATAEEVILSEVLTRIWTVVACEYDRRQGISYVSPVVRSVFLGHQQARQKALQWLMSLANAPQTEMHAAASGLDRLRRNAERWTDLLLGKLADDCEIDEAVFEPERAEEFARDLETHPPQDHQLAWRLTVASLRVAFRTAVASPSPNEDLNRILASGITACFRSELFDSTGLLRSLWMERLQHNANDAQSMIAELLQGKAISSRRGVFGNLPRTNEPD